MARAWHILLRLFRAYLVVAVVSGAAVWLERLVTGQYTGLWALIAWVLLGIIYWSRRRHSETDQTVP